MDDIQVLIVDPHQLAREGLRLLLAGEAYEVVCATTSLETALPEIEGGLRPRLLVSVLEDSGDTFQNATLQRVRAIVPECRVVLIAGNISSALLARALDWGRMRFCVVSCRGRCWSALFENAVADAELGAAPRSQR